jgi:RNA methyltransferase, TrmH family
MGRAYGSPEGPGTSLRRTAAASDDAAARIRAARRDPERVVLEGVHALKHAVRFVADVEVVATPDGAALDRLLLELAPDVRAGVHPTELGADVWRDLVPRELPSPALAVARRPGGGVAEVLAAPGRVLVLEEPRHLGNLGAAIRVAAAAGAGGVLVVGAADPWHPTAVRAAAGLQYALAVARTDTLPVTDRAVAALHPDGDELVRGGLSRDVVLLVGTERGGLSEALLARAEARWRLPMRAGVSSLNLATAVAAALYR